MHVIETGLELAAVILLAVLGWAVFVYFSPYRECRWCAWPHAAAAAAGAARDRKLTRRIGAKHVHKVKLSLQQAWQERP